MGYAARANPRSFDGAAAQRSVYEARARRFCEFFATRTDYERYLSTVALSDQELSFLESMLPERLKVGGTV